MLAFGLPWNRSLPECTRRPFPLSVFDAARSLHQDCPAIDHQGLTCGKPFLYQKQIGLRNIMSLADPPNRQTRVHAFKELLPFGGAHVLSEIGPDDSRRYGVYPDRRQLNRQRQRRISFQLFWLAVSRFIPLASNLRIEIMSHDGD